MLAIRKRVKAIVDNFPCSEDSSSIIVCFLEELGLGLIENGWLSDDAEFVNSEQYKTISAELSALMSGKE